MNNETFRYHTESSYDEYIPHTIGDLVYVGTETRWTLYKDDVPMYDFVNYIKAHGHSVVEQRYVARNRILGVNRIYSQDPAKATTHIDIAPKCAGILTEYPHTVRTVYLNITDEQYRMFVESMEK